jgi:hypothetical protein
MLQYFDEVVEKSFLLVDKSSEWHIGQMLMWFFIKFVSPSM